MNQTKINKILIVVIIFLFGSLLYAWFVIKEKSETPSIIPSAPEISYSPNEWKTWEDNYYKTFILMKSIISNSQPYPAMQEQPGSAIADFPGQVANPLQNVGRITANLTAMEKLILM